MNLVYRSKGEKNGVPRTLLCMRESDHWGLEVCHPRCVCENWERYVVKHNYVSVDKKNQLDVTFCILYLSSNSYSTCFGQPCAHHQELTTA